MKRVLSTVLAIVMVLSVCSSLTFTASAEDVAELTPEEMKVNYEIKTSGLKNGVITFDVYLAPNQTIKTALFSVKFDNTIFQVVAEKTGPATALDADGDPYEIVSGTYEQGIPVENGAYISNCYTFAYMTSNDFKISSSAKKFITVTLKLKDGKAGAVTGIDFYKGNYKDCTDVQNLIKNYSNIVALETPVMKNYWFEDGAIGFNWNAVDGAAGGYFVYKKVGNEYKTLADGISATSFKDVDKLVDGTTYTYAIASRDGIYGYPSIKHEFSITYVAPPTATISNVSNGVNVKWTKVSSADKYLVYRSTLQGDAWSSWETVGTANSTKLTYIDSTAKKGVTYRYAVSAVIDGVETGYKASASIKFVPVITSLATPEVTVKNIGTGVKVTWNKIANAEKYIVYSSTYSTKNKKWNGWTNRGTVTSTNWTDTAVKSGTKYKYTVKAVNGSVKSDVEASSSILFLAQPTVKIANASTGVKVTWNKITGATSYKVYRSEYKNGKWSSWKAMKTIDNGSTISWTDKSAKSGVKYKYTVKAVNGKTASTYKSSSSLLFLAQPKVAVKALSNGIKVAWVQSTGATSYKIYRSEYNTKTKKWSSWKGIKTAKSTSKSYTDKTAKKGVKYRYTVKAVNGKTASTYKASSSVKR